MAPPTRQEYCDAMKQILENSPHVSPIDMEKNVEIVKKAGELDNGWVFLHGCFPVLRPEFSTTLEHSNVYVQAVREALWTQDLSLGQ